MNGLILSSSIIELTNNTFRLTVVVAANGFALVNGITSALWFVVYIICSSGLLCNSEAQDFDKVPHCRHEARTQSSTWVWTNRDQEYSVDELINSKHTWYKIYVLLLWHFDPYIHFITEKGAILFTNPNRIIWTEMFQLYYFAQTCCFSSNLICKFLIFSFFSFLIISFLKFYLNVGSGWEKLLLETVSLDTFKRQWKSPWEN